MAVTGGNARPTPGAHVLAEQLERFGCLEAHGEADDRAVAGGAYIVCAWRYEGDSLHYDFTVPFGAEAELHLPGRAPQIIGPGSYLF